jgi:hypothetical protein
LGADEGLRAQSERDVGLRVPEQLPGDGRGILDAGGDLDPRVGETGAQGGPEVAGVPGGLKDLAEESLSEVGDPLLDAGGDGGRGIEWVLEVVL